MKRLKTGERIAAATALVGLSLGSAACSSEEVSKAAICGIERPIDADSVMGLNYHGPETDSNGFNSYNHRKNQHLRVINGDHEVKVDYSELAAEPIKEQLGQITVEFALDNGVVVTSCEFSTLD